MFNLQYGTTTLVYSTQAGYFLDIQAAPSAVTDGCGCIRWSQNSWEIGLFHVPLRDEHFLSGFQNQPIQRNIKRTQSDKFTYLYAARIFVGFPQHNK